MRAELVLMTCAFSSAKQPIVITAVRWRELVAQRCLSKYISDDC